MTFGRISIEALAQKRTAQKAANLAGLCVPANASGATMEGGLTGPAIQKGDKARPGKRAPTVEERAWMDAIVRFGCVACRADGLGFVAPQVHHILRGGKRMGHLFTLPLCADHHQDTGRPGYTARHPWKARFEAMNGTEAELLKRLRAEIGAAA